MRVCLYFIHFSSSSPIFWGFAFVAPWLVLFACFVCSCVFVVFVVVSFSLTDYTQKKKGRKGFALVSSLCLVLCIVVLDVLKHYRYLLLFIVTISVAFADDSSNVFRLFRWVVYYMPVFVYR